MRVASNIPHCSFRSGIPPPFGSRSSRSSAWLSCLKAHFFSPSDLSPVFHSFARRDCHFGYINLGEWQDAYDQASARFQLDRRGYGLVDHQTRYSRQIHCFINPGLQGGSYLCLHLSWVWSACYGNLGQGPDL